MSRHGFDEMALILPLLTFCLKNIQKLLLCDSDALNPIPCLVILQEERGKPIEYSVMEKCMKDYVTHLGEKALRRLCLITEVI